MKTANYFKQFLPAVAALTLVGTVSSCRDNDFDWDDAHANSQYEKFSNVFISKFGKPAEGHQWGYDLVRAAYNGECLIQPSQTRAQNGHFFKQDEGDPRPHVLYGWPDDIKLNEHQEVFAWFSSHKVDWTNNPSYYGQKKDGNLVDSRQNTGTASLNFEWYQKWVDPKISSIEDIKTNTTYPGYNTITNDAHRAENANALADPYVVPGRLSFHNGWVQHVAHDPTMELSQSEGGGNGTSKYSGNGNMDQLTFKGLEMDGTDWSSHTYDFNAGKGYGWERDTTITHVNPNGHQERDYMNAALYANVDFNEVVYNSSIDGKVHCKYLMVYLTGDDGNGNTWGGWYLGFDLEGYGTSNQYLKTDGFCNDWIIKVGDVGVGVFKQSRIMCEDLGGTISKNSSDIDYNDIVLDVTYDNNGSQIEIKPRCAGGTLPILICYNEEPLFEVHEFFLAKDDASRAYNTNNSYRLQAADYKTMINTKGAKTTSEGEFKSFGEYDRPSYKLLFGGSSSNNSILEKSFSGNFDIDLLQIKVYRHNLEDYVTNPGQVSMADWIDTGLLENGVPLKFIVPKEWTDDKYQTHEISWLQERQMITNGYKDFNKWVENPALWFWQDVQSGNETIHRPRIDTSYLY